MLVKVLEVVDNRKSYTNLCKEGKTSCFYSMKDAYVNPQFIVKVEVNSKMIENVKNGYFLDWMEKEINKPLLHSFVDVTFPDGLTMTIAGEPNQFLSNKAYSEKEILHG